MPVTEYDWEPTIDGPSAATALKAASPEVEPIDADTLGDDDLAERDEKEAN